MCGSKILCVFLDFGDARGLGPLFMVCACAIALCENRLAGMRGTWEVVWRSAHVPTIPFTWLRKANAWAPTAHASNYQALRGSLKLCQECRFNSCVRVFFIPWGHVSNHAHIWAFVTSISHMGEMRDSDWSREILLRSDWLLPQCSHIDYFRPRGSLLIEFTHSSGWCGGWTLIWVWLGGGGDGRLFEAGRLLTFFAFRMGAYSRWTVIRGWALIRINTVLKN